MYALRYHIVLVPSVLQWPISFLGLNQLVQWTTVRGQGRSGGGGRRLAGEGRAWSAVTYFNSGSESMRMGWGGNSDPGSWSLHHVVSCFTKWVCGLLYFGINIVHSLKQI